MFHFFKVMSKNYQTPQRPYSPCLDGVPSCLFLKGKKKNSITPRTLLKWLPHVQDLISRTPIQLLVLLHTGFPSVLHDRSFEIGPHGVNSTPGWRCRNVLLIYSLIATLASPII
ncbi:hypothetical protein A0H81_11480 [Grifola frondosa]|uniref:Uncharacterized protein n=1 Tax=Grifola frondosa TaxID=5627 RepID=A0A1C7LVE1_GRIFR|nr:hypothetical protein A0H81_11480 [Grifola frondosa]